MYMYIYMYIYTHIYIYICTEKKFVYYIKQICSVHIVTYVFISADKKEMIAVFAYTFVDCTFALMGRTFARVCK